MLQRFKVDINTKEQKRIQIQTGISKVGME